MQRKSAILLVDDDKAILASFRDILESRGYEVDTAQTGREAVDKSIAKVYNLAIIDMKLPDMEGTELLARFHSSHPRPKKIVVTGYPTMENAVLSVNLHADAYLVKPVQPDEFLRVVDEKIREKMDEEIVTEAKIRNFYEDRERKAKANPGKNSRQRTQETS